ncbi:E3 ubiquitin-protein ligase RNFT2-like [Cydia amplana]|uniref:E3 ubiquitin-protein ligase RNFT2-like n=1 Tax=Cydia amplana TaxID=1869771 RepID=UPI002FE62E7A
MIALVAKIINLFALTVRSVLLGASFVGHVIFLAVAGVCTALVNFVDSVRTFIQIVYEDNLPIFNEDIPNFTNDVIDTFVSQVVFVWNGVTKVYSDIFLKFSAIVVSIKWLIDSVFLVISEVLYIIKSAVICLGDALWLIVTFIPVQLPQLVKQLLRYLTEIAIDGIVSAYMTLLKFTNFLTDVPLESFMGIISAIVIVRLCIHFREDIQTRFTSLYWSVVRNSMYLYHLFYNYFTDSEVRVITSLVGGREARVREAEAILRAANDAADAADALCVICQERQKCVLTLPCRHICLCSECCMRLYGYQRTCPICRTFIYHSVTVYL